MAFQALKHKHHEFIHIVNTSNAHSVHGDRQDEPTGMSSEDPAGEVQSMEQKRGSPNRLVQGCPFSLGGGAGNRTPVRQGPTAGFSVRSPRFDVGSGLPETGSPHPSPLRLDPARESVTRGAVAISDVRRGSWRRKPQGTWTLFKRPVRNYRWRLLFTPCFASPGNSARCP